MTKMTATKKARIAADVPKGEELPSPEVMVKTIRARLDELLTLMTLAKVTRKVDVQFNIGPRQGDPNTLEVKDFRAAQQIGE